MTPQEEEEAAKIRSLKREIKVKKLERKKKRKLAIAQVEKDLEKTLRDHSLMTSIFDKSCANVL